MKHKMNDLLELPVSCETNSQGDHYLIDAYGGAFGDMVTVDLDNAVAHAINNHDKLTAQVEELKLAVAASNKALKLAKVGLSYSDDCFAGEYAAKCKKTIKINDELLTRIGEDNE